IPSTQYFVNETHECAISIVECRKLWMMSGLKTLSSKFPCEPATAIAVSLPITWIHTIVIASLWVGLTLPGMIDEPGSFSGSVSSARPQRGPEPIQRMSLAIFISDTASVLSDPDAATI